MSTLTIGTGRRPATPAIARVSTRPAGSAAPALRLTRRGRVLVRVLFAVLVLAVVAAGVLLVGGTAKADAVTHRVEVGYHVVRPGETLWQIAGEVAPRADRRDTVLRIAELNALPSGEVVPGQRLAVPAAG